jgi:hypothetical protein
MITSQGWYFSLLLLGMAKVTFQKRMVALQSIPFLRSDKEGVNV